MRSANKVFVLLVGLGALAGCQKSQPEQNIVMDNTIPANADIETLPPDESSETSSNELVNGDDNADVGDLNATGNDY